MSAVVKTITPFINKEMLLQALDCLNFKYTIYVNEIVTERVDFYGNQKFVFLNGRYNFVHDSSSNDGASYMINRYPWGNIDKQEYKGVSTFLQSVEKEYNRIYAEKLAELERIRQEQLAEQERIRLEEEMKRIEQERIAYVEKQKQTIIQKAKEQGYSVQEKKVNNKIKLILHRNTY
ncbi:MAG: hypothetical protein JXL97_03665 [Bacteroidales bacterium]|nr:hypothetical protein [Bacteroidales bacterium]